MIHWDSLKNCIGKCRNTIYILFVYPAIFTSVHFLSSFCTFIQPEATVACLSVVPSGATWVSKCRRLIVKSLETHCCISATCEVLSRRCGRAWMLADDVLYLTPRLSTNAAVVFIDPHCRTLQRERERHSSAGHRWIPPPEYLWDIKIHTDVTATSR